MDHQAATSLRISEGEDHMIDEDREQLQDPDADWDREDPRPEPPADPEHDELMAVGEDLPTDEEEFAAPPEPEARVTPDAP